MTGLIYHIGTQRSPDEYASAVRRALAHYRGLHGHEASIILAHPSQHAELPAEVNGVAITAGVGVLMGHVWLSEEGGE